MKATLRPHEATYGFLDREGGEAGTERLSLQRRGDGWLVQSRLEIRLPERLVTDVEWHLEPDLATRILYMSSEDHWGEEFQLELAVTGNGLLASRSAPSGPTQVEMGWGPDIQLDHVGAGFTTVMLARLGLSAGGQRRVTSVYIGAEDLLPEPLDQELRVLDETTVERWVPGTGDRARITLAAGGLVTAYGGLFRVMAGWRYTDTAPARPTK